MKVFWFYFIGYPVLMGSLIYYIYSIGGYKGVEQILVIVICFKIFLWVAGSSFLHKKEKE